MAEMKSNKVKDFLADIKSHFPEKYEVFDQVKVLFINNNPKLISAIKYGGIVFFEGKELIGGIFQYKKHISIEFSYGVKLPDPYSVLEGKGKLRRHIKIYNLDDVHTKEVAHYVCEATAYKPE